MHLLGNEKRHGREQLRPFDVPGARAARSVSSSFAEKRNASAVGCRRNNARKLMRSYTI
jgi:hypothetical protein